MTKRTDIPRALRQSIAEVGWTPTQLAAEAGVVETTARRWLNGERSMNADSLKLLADKMPCFRERLFPTKGAKA